MDLEEIIGWIAFSFSAYFLLFPIFPFLNVIQGKIDLEEAPGAYVTINYINCFCWYIYSLMIFSKQIQLKYLIGVVASGIFISIYFYYKIRKDAVDTILNALILGLGSYMVYSAFVYRIEDDEVIGKICTGSHCLLYFFPLIILYKVIRQKKYILIPFYKVCGSLISSICWIIYGIMIKEIYVVRPHYINLVLSPILIILFYYYKKKYPIIDFNIEISSQEERHRIKEEIEKNRIIKPVIIFENNNI